MADTYKGCTEIDLQDPSMPAHSPMHFAVYGTRTKVDHVYPDLSDKQTGWLEAHHFVP